MNKVLPLLLALGVSASAASVTLQQGQTAKLGERKITVLRVQDSRCPPDVQCIRAGEIIAKVLVSEKNHTRFLTLQLPEGNKAVWQGIRLEKATFDRWPKLTLTDIKP